MTRGDSAPPPGRCVGGIASPHWTLANFAAALCCVATHLERKTASSAGAGALLIFPEKSSVSTSSSQPAPAGAVDTPTSSSRRTRRPARSVSESNSANEGASRPSREKCSCWLSALASPVDVAGPSPSAKPRRDRGSVGLRAPGRCVTSKRKSSISSSQRTNILFRCLFVLSHVIAWLSDDNVCPQVEVGPPARRPRRPAAQQVVPERAQHVHHRQQFEDVRRVVSLRRRQRACCSRMPQGAGAPRRPATATLLASVVNTELLAGSKVCNAGADERANISASKLAWASGVHAKRAVGLPSAVSGAATSE
jgi:hypothetical protein